QLVDGAAAVQVAHAGRDALVAGAGVVERLLLAEHFDLVEALVGLVVGLGEAADALDLLAMEFGLGHAFDGGGGLGRREGPGDSVLRGALRPTRPGAGDRSRRASFLSSNCNGGAAKSQDGEGK